MRIGDYEFPVDSTCVIESNCGFNSMSISTPIIKFLAVFQTNHTAKEVKNIIKSGKCKSIDFCINDNTTITGEVVNCHSHFKNLYIYVRFSFNE